jgi:hypothetical protein
MSFLGLFREVTVRSLFVFEKAINAISETEFAKYKAVMRKNIRNIVKSIEVSITNLVLYFFFRHRIYFGWFF